MSKCICKGNWRELVSEYEPLFGKTYVRDYDKEEYIFFGLVHAEDDYYYGMWTKGSMELLSCVGSLENFGYTLKGNNDT